MPAPLFWNECLVWMPKRSDPLLRVVLPLVAHNPQAGRYALKEPRLIWAKVPPRCRGVAKASRSFRFSRCRSLQSDRSVSQCAGLMSLGSRETALSTGRVSGETGGKVTLPVAAHSVPLMSVSWKATPCIDLWSWPMTV